MRRGEIWTVSASGYAGKPLPAVIVQSDAFAATASVTVCLFTTDVTEAPLFRLPVAPSSDNGLHAASRLMVDKLVTVSRKRLGSRVGRLDEADMAALNRAMLVFLGVA